MAVLFVVALSLPIERLAGINSGPDAEIQQLSANVHVSPEGIPFTVQGTCAEPVFRPDVKAVAKEEIKSVGTGLLKSFFGEKKK